MYCQGEHERLKPGKKDVFVHDYSRKFGSSLATVKELYEKQGIYLWRLRGAEFLDEVVNYQAGDHKNGDQYAVVVMALSQCPGLDFGNALGAAYESPAHPGVQPPPLSTTRPTATQARPPASVRSSPGIPRKRPCRH